MVCGGAGSTVGTALRAETNPFAIAAHVDRAHPARRIRELIRPIRVRDRPAVDGDDDIALLNDAAVVDREDLGLDVENESGAGLLGIDAALFASVRGDTERSARAGTAIALCRRRSGEGTRNESGGDEMVYQNHKIPAVRTG